MSLAKVAYDYTQNPEFQKLREGIEVHPEYRSIPLNAVGYGTLGALLGGYTNKNLLGVGVGGAIGAGYGGVSATLDNRQLTSDAEQIREMLAHELWLQQQLQKNPEI